MFYFHIICSLENAGEGSVLPMLRSVRLVLDIFAVSSCEGIDVQVVQFLFSVLLHKIMFLNEMATFYLFIVEHVAFGSVLLGIAC